ncbi:MAG: hypothetical protein HKN21_11845, partial [Candidatus Eisenbacteria bacterium]|nr:hypothetical protein [Candidatus Eisenbacteria bacterium]
LKHGYPDGDLALRPGDTITIPSKSGGFGDTFRTIIQFSGILSGLAGVILATSRL